MTAEQVQEIVRHAAFPGAAGPAKLVETHISWVVLTPEFAFKIKKPLQLEFLDFSSLEQRQYYCNQELQLNRRLAPEMYLAVLPIRQIDNQIKIGATTGLLIDYALQMQRIDSASQMDLLVRNNQVSALQMEQLAAVLVRFHRQVILPPASGFQADFFWTDFAELYHFKRDIKQLLGTAAHQRLLHGEITLPDFLKQHQARLIERRQQGFWVDGHGDLHTRNIFLLPDRPVVFDCIEFSAHFRQSDILNELAFLCMDLEAQGCSALARHFLNAYCLHWNLFPKAEDHLLFLFFKAYRANIRLKISLLEIRQHSSPLLKARAQQYWELLSGYVKEMGC